jgi:dolichol-phosphate mannosyltransferase
MGGVLILRQITDDANLMQPNQVINQHNRNLSVVIPVHNEEENIGPLVKEISDILLPIIPHEIICVDDDSTDNTLKVLIDLNKSLPEFKSLQHVKKKGQSAAICSGVTIAKGPLIATLDGDGQNDPADIPKLLEKYYAHSGEDGRLMVIGWRKGRSDGWRRRTSSRIANIIRSWLLSDHTPDTGCGLKIFKREDFVNFPLFDHMHRFLPALMLRSGGRVISVEVNHRRRMHGKSHYGILNRMLMGITDLAGVSWLNRRKIEVEIRELTKSPNGPESN